MKWHEHYPAGIPHSFDYPRLPLKHYFNESAQKHPDRALIIFHDVALSFSEANTLARKLANGLVKAGCKKQDRVALVINNRPEFVLAVQACYKIGATFVSTNPLYTARELEHILNDSQAETVIIVDAFLGKIHDLLAEGRTSVKRVIVINDQNAELPLLEGADSLDILDYAQLLAASEDSEPEIEVFADDCATLQYTGGTTGGPKGCMLSNANLEATVYGWSSWYTSPLAADEYPIILNPVPLYHIYGLVGSINLAAFAGGTIVLLDNLSAGSVIAAIRDHRPNILCSVPATLVILLNHPEIQDVNMDSIKVIGIGGDSLPESIRKEFGKLSEVNIVVGYGLSETAGSVCGQPHTIAAKPGSIGLPLPDVEVRIMSMQDRFLEVPCGELGELAIRGPQVTGSYWNQPEETDLALCDGWLYTGDIGYMDEEGWLFIKDRLKDLIICGGFNVYPKEIDEVLYMHPSIKEACTIGIPDAHKGELIKSYIVLRPEKELSEDEVKEHCQQYLAAYKVPRIVEFLDALPRTTVGKPSRIALREKSQATRE